MLRYGGDASETLYCEDESAPGSPRLRPLIPNRVPDKEVAEEPICPLGDEPDFDEDIVSEVKR